MPGFRSEVMVGREQELRVLRELGAQARSGRPATAVVLGEAGVGKTRLALELAAELESAGWLCPVSHGVALAGGELAYGATAELLRALVRDLGVADVRRALGRRAAGLAALVPALDPSGSAPLADRGELMASVLQMMEAIRRPLCWVLDDLQWMDEASRDLATYLSRVTTGAAVLLLGTVRTTTWSPADLPEELDTIGRAGTVIALSPLSPAEVATQVARIPDGDLDPAQVARICELSDGLPFFVEQLVAHDGQWSGSLRSVVLAGVRSLSPAARELLAAAAVGEGLLTRRLLREVSELGPGFDEALAEVRERGVLRPDRDGEQLRFRHSLLREAVDLELLADERRDLHRAWGDALDAALLSAPHDQRLVMERARHGYAVGGTDAFPAALAAAQAAEVVHDERVRARWWGRVLELWPTEERAGGATLERDLALKRYLEALWAVGSPHDAERVLDRELLGEQDWVRSLWLGVARQRVLRALQRSFVPLVPAEDAEVTVARLRAIPSDFRVTWLLANLADDWLVDHPQLVVSMLEEAIERADPTTDAAVVLDAYSLLGWSDAVTGDPDDEVARMRQAVEWAQRHHPSVLLSARVSLCASLVNAGHCVEAAALARENLREIGDPRLRPHLWVVQQLVLAAASRISGDWDLSARCLELADTDACGGVLAGFLHFQATALAARRGDVAAARRHRDAIPESPVDAPLEQLSSQERLLRAAATFEIGVAEGDVELVRAVCLLITDLVPPQEPPISVWEFSAQGLRVAVGRGERDEAGIDFLAATTQDLAARNDRGRLVQACRAEVETHRARVADIDSAQDWATVARCWSDLGRPYDVAWCRLFEAECALRDRERDRARTLLHEAWETCAHLGAVPLQQRLEATARRGRIEGVGERGRRGGLTERESEVVELLAEGRTNAEIAETLFMSPKTASVHVTHIIAKLGAANRTEAVALARRQGLVDR